MQLLTCRLCATPVSAINAIHQGLCRSHAQLERVARAYRAFVGESTQSDLLIDRMNANRRRTVKLRPCETCGKLIRYNKKPVARCLRCFIAQRYGNEKRDLVNVSMRLPINLVNALRLQAKSDGRTLVHLVELTLARGMDGAVY